MNFERYPEVDRADELKRQSVSLLGAAVPPDRFIHREESQNDKGVDLHFEAVIAGRATRFCAVVQVKATDSTALNADGSFSFSVKTRNLNYLLNGQCPLYIVWLAARGEFRYAWAREEAKRLHGENPSWDEQESVVIRFSRPLDGGGWQDIYDRVQREGRFSRQQHDYLARAGLAEGVALGVNPETLDVLTPDAAFDAISEHGIAIVSAGYPSAVKYYHRFLTQQQAHAPAVLLALGYACYHLGEHYEARGHLSRVIARRELLSTFDRHFLDSLVNECDLRFGRVDEAGYRARQRSIEAEAPEFLAIQVRLERLRWEHMAERDTDRRRAVLQSLRGAVAEIESVAGSTDALRLQAALVLTFAEIAEANIGYMEAVIRMHTRVRMRQNPVTSTTMRALAEATAAEDKVHRDTQELLRRAIELGNPLLIAEAVVTQCVHRIGSIDQKSTLLRMTTGRTRAVPGDVVAAIQKQLEQAVSLFNRAGATESVVRATLLLAQWLSTNSDHEKAKELVDGVMGVAHGMGYAHYVTHGEAILARTTELDLHARSLAEPPDCDEIAANQSDEEVADFARFSLTTTELPAGRLPVIHRVSLVLRDESRTRLEWCKHFHFFVDHPHTEILPTSFATDPNWLARCDRFGYRTHTPSPDAGAVTARFKSTFCNTCTDRCPKRGGSE